MVQLMPKKKKSSVRDLWIPESWRASGCGPHKNKKKLIPRKQKYKGVKDENSRKENIN